MIQVVSVLDLMPGCIWIQKSQTCVYVCIYIYIGKHKILQI